MKRTLAGGADHDANNFNLLRLVCATAVIVSHAFPLTTGQASIEPLYATGMTLGMYAVVVFFAVSGFLVAGSFYRNADLQVFFSARARRILPAYMVAILISVLIIGAAVTNLPAADYYTSGGTIWHIVSNAAFLTAAKTLPGVFAENPHAGTVNGSLWSLPLEILCYIFLYCAGRCGMLRARCCLWYVAGSLALVMVWRAFGASSPLPHVFPGFLAGVAFYVYRHRVRASTLCLAALIAATYATQHLFIHPELLRVTIAYGALSFGTATNALGRHVARGGDYSYGLYLYGWPVTQTIVYCFPTLRIAGVIALALPVSALFAIASWHLIEQPALRRRGRQGSRTGLGREEEVRGAAPTIPSSAPIAA